MPTLPDLEVGPAATHRAVTVVPLFFRAPDSPPRYRLGCEALAAGVLEVCELGAGAVDKLSARNRGRDRVLLLEGDHLVGAKQNRVLTSSAIVGGKRQVTLPVACVEQGRWQGASQRFAATAQMASAGVRRLLKLSVRMPELLVGDGHELTTRDPWTGATTAVLACAGLPVAYGDPFGSEHGFLVTASGEAIEIWRGRRCPRYAMQWSGARGDLWRSGTFGFGPH